VYLSYHFLVEDPLGLSLLGGLAVVRCLRRRSLAAWLKWPNDVYLEGRKLAGVLPDVRWSGQQCQGAVLGLGLNVRVENLPAEACSLHEWIGDVQVDSLGQELMAELEALVDQHRQLGLRAYLEEVRECSLPAGTLVEYSQQGRLCQGRVVGLHEQGWLLLEGQPPLVQVDWLRAPHFLPPAT
jgi:BirA family biotin operon repressor/biotin-[acetyl-CoA-carboxylase] ligase